jgi:hypothetical protein
VTEFGRRLTGLPVIESPRGIIFTVVWPITCHAEASANAITPRTLLASISESSKGGYLYVAVEFTQRKPLVQQDANIGLRLDGEHEAAKSMVFG